MLSADVHTVHFKLPLPLADAALITIRYIYINPHMWIDANAACAEYVLSGCVDFH